MPRGTFPLDADGLGVAVADSRGLCAMCAFCSVYAAIFRFGWLVAGWVREWIDGWMDEWVDGWMSGWIDG